MLLGHSFDLRPNSRAFGIAGSVMTSSLLINECSQRKNQFDEGKPFSSPEPLGLICNRPVVSLVSQPRYQETTGSGDENDGKQD